MVRLAALMARMRLVRRPTKPKAMQSQLPKTAVFGVSPLDEGRYRIVRIVRNKGAGCLSVTCEEVATDTARIALGRLGYRAGADTVLSLPRRHAILRWLTLPTRDPVQIVKMIEYECVSLAAWPAEECIFGYQVVADDGRGYSLVLVILVQRDMIVRETQALRALGIHPTTVEISTTSVCRLIDGAFADASPSILSVTDTGYEYVRLSPQGTPLFSRATGAEGAAIDMLRQSLDLEQRKGDAGDGPSSLLVIADSTQCSDDELRALSLGECQVSRFADLHMPILNGASGMPTIDAICVGAALAAASPQHTADLLPVNDKRRILLRRVFRRSGYVALLCAWTIALVAGFAYSTLAIERYRAQTAQTEIDSLGGEVNDLADKSKQLQRLDAERAQIALPLHAIMEIYRICPAEVAVNSFRYDARHTVILAGEAKTYAAVYQFVDILRKSQLFRAPELLQCAKPKGTGAELVEFKVTCKLSGKGNGDA